MADGRAIPRDDAANGAENRVLRRAVITVVAFLLLGAGYLIAVRYEAILADLQNLSAWCF